MSDDQFINRAARQRKLIIVLLVLATSGACLFFAVRNTFYDRCTASFDRSPQAVAQHYLAAVAGGDADRAQSCWVREQFFNLEAGCSEICLLRALGSGFTVTSLQVGEPRTTAEGRSAIEVQVEASCPDGSVNSGTLVFDSLASNIPWKHWRVNQSSVGGNAADAWCD